MQTAHYDSPPKSYCMKYEGMTMVYPVPSSAPDSHTPASPKRQNCLPPSNFQVIQTYVHSGTNFHRSTAINTSGTHVPFIRAECVIRFVQSRIYRYFVTTNLISQKSRRFPTPLQDPATRGLEDSKDTHEKGIQPLNQNRHLACPCHPEICPGKRNGHQELFENLSFARL
ncbi:hypothetical protein SODALDRAFT_321970 [Sodiomyces alkalinus F11]|uniref:Uncharacterized protein n=1 Tax=Sodiomyces alkalinus (strain CBS 110278 / VKM F-3762 / F11) TaxID=1314773 RepID=A0A3N2Q1N0_SODAK|nr:hypothetical protein SODALDRAFT_321970 [Sodiomyces alkalinus F11]ROT40664.1 hypothetical protein SODALDRAFT_321970 [Sodiomyces alkalinus F11]